MSEDLRTHRTNAAQLIFVLILGKAGCFGSGKRVASCLELVPLEESSGNRRRMRRGAGRLQRLHLSRRRAIETPKTPEVRFHDMIIVALGDHGGISHVIDDTGEETAIRRRVAPKVRDCP